MRLNYDFLIIKMSGLFNAFNFLQIARKLPPDIMKIIREYYNYKKFAIVLYYYCKGDLISSTIHISSGKNEFAAINNLIILYPSEVLEVIDGHRRSEFYYELNDEYQKIFQTTDTLDHLQEEDGPTLREFIINNSIKFTQLFIFIQANFGLEHIKAIESDTLAI